MLLQAAVDQDPNVPEKLKVGVQNSGLVTPYRDWHRPPVKYPNN
jgi:hypothetical protein